MKIKEKFQEIYDADIEGYGDAEKFKSDLNKNTVIWAMFEEYVANEV